MNGKKGIMARWFIIAGIILIVVGLVLYFAPGVLHWFGRLPGDIRIGNERRKVFIPITSMVLVSIILIVIVNLIRWLVK
jgi:H+/Cl- antiporter ClcA